MNKLNFKIMEWFKLTGANPTFSTSYTSVGSNPPSCLGIDQICAIQAEKELGTSKPILTEELKDEMILALHSRSSSANVLLEKSL